MTPVKPALISGIIIIGISCFLTYQIYTEQQQKALLIQQETLRISELQEERSRVVEKLSLLEAYRRRLAPSSDTVWLVRQIGKLSSETGVVLASIDPQKPHPLGEFIQYGVSVRFQATYHELGVFLAEIESSEHYLHVDRTILVAEPSIEGSTRASLQMKISTLFLPPIQ